MNSRKVDFAICGTQKGGTTALYAYLRSHPEICTVRKKELHYFDTETNFPAGGPDYAAYHANFRPKPAHRLLGEATPVYMYWWAAPQRIWQYNPDMKLIVMLRNPIDRAYSQWNMARERGKEALPFPDAIRSEAERAREALPLQHLVYSYVDRGFYLEQLRRLWAFFPARQVLVMKSEDLQDQPRETLDRVCAFLDVPPLADIEEKNVHARPYPEPMGATERDHLRSVFEYEIRDLERVLGWDLNHWLT